MTDIIPISEQIYGFVNDLEVSLDLYVKDIKCDGIVLYGMGGSAISNDVVSDYCIERSWVPMAVIKSPRLPKCADKDTLAILTSYSGNTLETIEAYGYAKSRGCQVIVLSSGGRLRSLAKKNGDMYIPLPPRMHPRHSIGYMIGYIISIVEATGCKNISKDISDVIPDLKKYRKELENGEAVEKLAKKIIGHVPVVCSHSEIGSITFRWKTQLNENSKMVAFCTTISKMLNSDLSVWKEKTDTPFKLLVLTYGKNDAEAQKLIERLDGAGVDYEAVHMEGTTQTENMFRMLMLGDIVTVKIAALKGIDSSAVPPINVMKERMKEFSDGRYEIIEKSD